MTGYTKLFSSIVGSTVWRADNETRLVWITMLALADRNGCVEASIPGLADFARVSLTACERALDALSSPDEYSRSKALEGRRIVPIDGGWQLVNHGKYRAAMSEDARREYLKNKQREHRDRLKASVNTASTNVNNRLGASTRSTQAKAEAAPDSATTRPRAVHPATVTAVTPFDDFWQAYPRKTAKAKAQKAWDALTPVPEISVVLKALEWQRAQPDWLKEDGKFIPYPASWLNGRRWEDEPFKNPPIEARLVKPHDEDPVGRLVSKARISRYHRLRYFRQCDIEWRDGRQVLVIRGESYPGELSKLFGQQLREAGVDFVVEQSA